jgi:hypothetical protein
MNRRGSEGLEALVERMRATLCFYAIGETDGGANARDALDDLAATLQLPAPTPPADPPASDEEGLG